MVFWADLLVRRGYQFPEGQSCESRGRSSSAAAEFLLTMAAAGMPQQVKLYFERPHERTGFVFCRLQRHRFIRDINPRNSAAGAFIPKRRARRLCVVFASRYDVTPVRSLCFILSAIGAMKLKMKGYDSRGDGSS